MENYKLVHPEHLNHYGYLFGGTLLKWVDEVAWIAASLDFPGCRFVTIGMDKVEFRKSVKQGSLLRFLVERVQTGNTSVKYTVNVFAGGLRNTEEIKVFSTNVSFVCLDDEGRKTKIHDQNV
jgi:acyl-CoA hydrolase